VSGATLWLERAEAARGLHEARGNEPLQSAIVHLLGRLLGLGSLDPALGPEDIGVIGSSAAGLRAVLLAPERLRIGDALAPAHRLREATRIARSIVPINP
jgi:hypothetical protein